MNNRIIVAIIIGFIVILGALFWFFSSQTEQQNTPIVEERGFFDTVFPFRSSPDSQGDQLSDNEPSGQRDLRNESAPRLRQVSSAPTSGAVVIEKEVEEGLFVPVIRYVERASGHIYDAETETLYKEKVSNVTIPEIYEALWFSNGERVLLRSLNEQNVVETFSAELKELSEETEAGLDGFFLQDNIEHLSILGEQIGWGIVDNNKTTFVVSNPDGSNQSIVATSNLTQSQVNWPTSRYIIMTSLPNSRSVGTSMKIDTVTGKRDILAEERGVTVLPNSDASQFIVSATLSEGSSGYQPQTVGILDTKSKFVSPLIDGSMAEKCVWSEINVEIVYCAAAKTSDSGIFPEDWYQGRTHTSDEIWRINTETQSTELLIFLEQESGSRIDAIDLILDNQEEHIVFRNKRDLSLWSLRLTGLEGEEQFDVIPDSIIEL